MICVCVGVSKIQTENHCKFSSLSLQADQAECRPRPSQAVPDCFSFRIESGRPTLLLGGCARIHGSLKISWLR